MYHNFSVWLDMQDASSQDRNPPKFMLGWWHTSKTSLWFSVSLGIQRICIDFCLFTFYVIEYQSALFIRRALHYLSGNRYFPHQSAQHTGGASIYIYIYIYHVSVYIYIFYNYIYIYIYRLCVYIFIFTHIHTHTHI